MFFLNRIGIRKSVVNDLEWFRSSPIVPNHMKDKVRGLIFDIQTGKVEEVK